MSTEINHMEKWLNDNKDTVFRFCIYRRMFTPEEQNAKYSDETHFENGGCYTIGIIEDFAHLDDDWLIGFRSVFEDGGRGSNIEYVRLSEIRLHKFDCDQTLLDMEADEYDEG